MGQLNVKGGAMGWFLCGFLFFISGSLVSSDQEQARAGKDAEKKLLKSAVQEALLPYCVALHCFKDERMKGNGAQVSPKGFSVIRRDKNKMYVYNASTGCPTGTLSPKITDWTTVVQWNKDETRIATFAGGFPDKRTVIQIWDTADLSNEIGRIRYKRGGYNVFSFGGNVVATAGQDSEPIKMYDIGQKKEQEIKHTMQTITCMQLSDDNNVLVAGDTFGAVAMFDVNTRKYTELYKPEEPSIGQRVNCIAFNKADIKKAAIAVGFEHGQISIGNAGGFCTTIKTKSAAAVYKLGFSPSGARLAALEESSSEPDKVRVYDVATGACVATLQNKLITDFLWRPDGAGITLFNRYGYEEWLLSVPEFQVQLQEGAGIATAIPYTGPVVERTIVEARALNKPAAKVSAETTTG